MISRGLTAIVVMVMALLVPAVSDAKEYIWQDRNGDWNDENNWLQVCLPGQPCPGGGFPNAPGDVAHFTLSYSADRRVTIPQGVQITVGTIHSTSQKAITIEVGGTGLQTSLLLDNGVNAALVHKEQFGLNNVYVNVDTYLRSSLRVDVESGAVVVRFLGELDGVRTVTKTGPGELFLDAATAYNGRTTVEDGSLYLRSASGPSIWGELVVGDGIGAAASADAVLLDENQIADHVTVRVNADGQFTATRSDRVGHLRVENGRVAIPDLPVSLGLTVGGLTMTGGTIEMNGQNLLVLAGSVTATSSSAQPATIRGSARLTLGDTSRTFTVGDGPRPIDVLIGVPIVGTGSAGVTKDGAGTLQFTEIQSNNYPGVTRVLGGRLELDRHQILLGGVTAVPGRLEIGGAGPATVALLPGNLENIADTADIVVMADGVLIGQRTERIRDLTVESGGRVILGGPGSSSQWTAVSVRMTGGRMTFGFNGGLIVAGNLTAISTASETATIDVDSDAFPLSFVGTTRSLVVSDGPRAIDLRIDATAIAESGQLTKQGAGVVQCNWPTAAALKTTVSDGTLLATGTMARHDVTVGSAGRLGGTGTIRTIESTGGGPSRRGSVQAGSPAPR